MNKIPSVRINLLVFILLMVLTVVISWIGFISFDNLILPKLISEKLTATALAASPTPEPTVEVVETPTVTPEPPRAKVFYVSPDGDNTQPGTIDHPWFSIQHAVDQAEPGDTIYLRGGMYPESVNITRSGVDGQPIKIAAFDSESVTLDGGPGPAIKAEGSYWTVSSIRMMSEADRTIHLNATNWVISDNTILGSIYIWGDHNLIANNDVDGSLHKGNENGIMDDGEGSHHNRIINNQIHDFHVRGVWTQWFTHDNVIERNHVYNIMGEKGICIDLDGASSVEYRHVVRGNVVHDCSQSGIELENSYETIVENNLVYRTKLEAIQIISYDTCKVAGENQQYGDADGDCRGDPLNTIVQQNIIFDGGRVGGIVSYSAAGVKVYNNTVFGCDSVALYIHNPVEFSNNWEVRGNIFAGNSRAEISVVDPMSITVDDTNLIYHPEIGRAYEIRGALNLYFSLADWQYNYGLGTSSIALDPIFVDPQKANFHLQANSPAINFGPDVGLKLDFDGNPRPSGGGFDLGAYEFNIYDQ